MATTDADAGATWPAFESFLAEASKKAVGKSPVSIAIRDLLAHVEAERRGTRVIGEIQQALDRHGLVTEPSFTSGWIDNVVELRSASTAHSPTSNQAPQAEPNGDSAQSSEISLNVSSLKSAGAGAVSIERNGDLARARALMLRHDYSQLGVMAGAHRLIGAVSWESMARAAIRNPDFTLRDATITTRPVSPDDDLIALIPTIIEQGFVFVAKADHSLGGIVTTADLSSQFGTVAKPFLLIGEIERRLRRVLSTHFQPAELAGVRDPTDTNRTIKTVSDLTLGEIARCIENEKNWQRLSWPVDRTEFINALGEVREIRNDVMHFSPDPLTMGEDEILHNFVRWLRVMEPSP
jgi:hypothetical protein